MATLGMQMAKIPNIGKKMAITAKKFARKVVEISERLPKMGRKQEKVAKMAIESMRA
jgi:hypothetical protein